MTASFGAYETKPGIETLKMMIAEADHCLYDAKESGRNRVSSVPRNNNDPAYDQRQHGVAVGLDVANS